MAANHSAPLATLLAAIPSLPRPLLSRLVQQMIDRLDDMDGDCDLEDSDADEDDDPAGSPTLYAVLPVYDIDQSKGPINATDAFRKRMTELLGVEQ